MTTLSDLHALLERALTHADNAAILRLPERTVEDVARAYLPRTIWIGAPGCQTSAPTSRLRRRTATLPLDLTDPGTTHALLVALALSHGRDPGPMALEVILRRIDEPTRRINDEEQEEAVVGWFLYTADGGRSYTDDEEDPAVCGIALEPDPIKALALAVRHVLEAP